MTEQSQVDHNIGPESYIGAGELTSQSQGAHEYWDRPIVDEELSFIWMRTCVHARWGSRVVGTVRTGFRRREIVYSVGAVGYIWQRRYHYGRRLNSKSIIIIEVLFNNSTINCTTVHVAYMYVTCVCVTCNFRSRIFFIFKLIGMLWRQQVFLSYWHPP